MRLSLRTWAVNIVSGVAGFLLARGAVFAIAPDMHFPLWFYGFYLVVLLVICTADSVRATP